MTEFFYPYLEGFQDDELVYLPLWMKQVVKHAGLAKQHPGVAGTSYTCPVWVRKTLHKLRTIRFPAERGTEAHVALLRSAKHNTVFRELLLSDFEATVLAWYQHEYADE